MELFNHLIYDNSLHPPKGDQHTGEPKKSPFPGQRILEQNLEAAFPDAALEKIKAGELEMTFADGTTKTIVFRYSGDGDAAFGGIKEELLQKFDGGDLVIITVVATAKDSNIYRWREVTKKPKPKREDGSWGYSKKTLTGAPKGETECADEIVTHLKTKLGGAQ